jgi:hypothetical protein
MKPSIFNNTRLSKVAMLLAVALLGSPLAALAGPGTFTETGGLTTARMFPMATLLSNGKVLVAGGLVWESSQGYVATNSAELYDPNTGTFAPTGSMWSNREEGTTTLLPNGKVLVAGGKFGSTQTTETAEIFDPATGAFTLTGSMSIPRTCATATLLANGKVLVAGGLYYLAGISPIYIKGAELFDPATGAFTQTGTMSVTRCGHTATLLQSGQVLIAGGADNTAELYDPATGSFISTGNMNVDRSSHSASLLSDGRVLLVGGYYNPTSSTVGYAATAEIYDPATHQFSLTGSMVSGGRVEFTASTLPNGAVLVAGGLVGNVPGSTDAELYNPATGTFLQTGSLLQGRYVGAAVTLQSGQALVVGGNYAGNGVADAELFRMSNDPLVVAPTVTETFNPTKVVLGGSTKMTIKLTNPNPVDITAVGFTDTYPISNVGTEYPVSDIVNASFTSVSNSCGGTVTMNPNDDYVQLVNGTIPANSSCSLTVYVVGNDVGSWSNPIGVVTSYNAWPNPGNKTAPGNSIASLAVMPNIVIKCPPPYNTCM